MITKPTSQTQARDSNDDSGNIAFIALFAVSFVINILLTTVVIYFVVKARKTGYSPNDAVEMHSQKVKTSSTTDYDYPLVSSSSKMPSTAKSSQDIKADAVKLQDNPSYVATNEFS